MHWARLIGDPTTRCILIRWDGIYRSGEALHLAFLTTDGRNRGSAGPSISLHIENGTSRVQAAGWTSFLEATLKTLPIHNSV